MPFAGADEFLPAPRYELHAGPAFWPDTFFVDMTPVPEEWLSRVTPEHVDSRTGELRLEAVTADMALASGTLLHERLHWFQGVGTSFGYLMSRLRILRGELALCTLSTCPPETRGRLFELRRAGRSIAARNAAGQLLHDQPYAVTIQSLLDHWWGTVAADRFLNDGNTRLLGAIPPQFLVGMIVRYLEAGDDIRAVFESPDAAFLEWCRAAGPRDALPFDLASGTFTVRHIDEGAAVAAQLLYLERISQVFAREGRGGDAETIGTFVDTRMGAYRQDPSALYLEAMRRMEAACPDVERGTRNPRRRWLEEFLLVCDLALNPLLAAGDQLLPLTWQEWHPVSRFERLLAAAAATGPQGEAGTAPASPDWWRQRRQNLLLAAQLTEQTGPISLGRATTDTEDGNAPHIRPASYVRRFLSRAHADAIKARAAIPAFAASPGDALLDAAEQILVFEKEGHALCFDCPLVIFGDEGQHFRIDTRDYIELLMALTDLRIATSVLASSGPIDFRGLPRDSTAMIIRADVIRRFETLVGASVG
jgi:hypothetical protein